MGARRKAGIVNEHRSLWRGLSATARKRAACTPFLLVDLHFQDADWWRSAKDPRPSRRRKTVLHAAFTGKIAGELMRETLTLAWSTVAFDRGAPVKLPKGHTIPIRSNQELAELLDKS